jgi:hypothetical protein
MEQFLSGFALGVVGAVTFARTRRLRRRPRSKRPDVAPVIVAQVLLTLRVSDEVASEYLASMWPLTDGEVHAAVATAHALIRGDRSFPPRDAQT